VALEGAALACETFALWRLYGDDRGRLSAGEMIRAGLVGYVPMVLLPAGRAVAEAVRAGLLARRTSGPLAAAVAVQMQLALLLAVSGVSFACAVSMLLLAGPGWLALAMAANGAITGALAAAMLAAGRRSRIGGWLAKHWGRFRGGPEFDLALRGRPPLPVAAIAAAFAGRLLQVGQLGVLFFGIAGHVDPLRAFAVEGVHLVGATLGDLIPAQLGASDATFSFSAGALGLPAGGALTIALLAHATQAVWCAAGALAPLLIVWRKPSAAQLPASPQ